MELNISVCRIKQRRTSVVSHKGLKFSWLKWGFILAVIVMYCLFGLTDGTKLAINKTNVKTKNWLALVIIDKPKHEELYIYESLAGNPFDNARYISPEFVTKNISLTNSAKEINNETVFQKDTRSKRGVLDLVNMIHCATGCNPLTYKRYGCYCGFLGSGYVVDGIDECCKYHDWCYATADCPMWSQYFIPYYWTCYRHRPLCGSLRPCFTAIRQGEWEGLTSCAFKLCDCDRKLAECLRRYPCPSTKALCPSSPFRFLQKFL